MIRLGRYRIGKIDWNSDDFTYGQRIELGDIFQNDSLSDYWKMCEAFRVMYGFDRRVLPMALRIKAFTNIAKGFRQWLEKENTMLDYRPSNEEVMAGVKELTMKVGHMSTVKSLAQTYATDPDRVLEWSYSKVFIILYTDLEERKYEKKLSKQYERHTRFK